MEHDKINRWENIKLVTWHVATLSPGTGREAKTHKAGSTT